MEDVVQEHEDRSEDVSQLWAIAADVGPGKTRSFSKTKEIVVFEEKHDMD